MGYRDSQMILSEEQANVLGIAVYPSTNVYDMGAAQDNGVGFPIWVYVNIGEVAMTAAAGAILTVLVETSDTVGGTYVPLLTTVGIAADAADATTAAGLSLIKAMLPANCKRFVRVSYIVTVAAVTAGTFDAGFELTPQANNSYPKGFVVA